MGAPEAAEFSGAGAVADGRGLSAEDLAEGWFCFLLLDSETRSRRLGGGRLLGLCQ